MPENSVSEERVEECRGRMGAGLQTLAAPSLRPGGRGGAGQGRAGQLITTAFETLAF